MQMEPPPELKCFVVNDGSSVGFPVRDVRDVTGLQTKIKTLAPNTVTCNADKLQLYLARMSDQWLSLKEAKALESDPDGRIVDEQTRLVQSFTLLNQEDELEKALKGLALEKGKIHVLVVVPKKRARAASAPEQKGAAKILKVGGDEWPTLRDAAQQVANIGVTLNRDTDLAVGERLTNLPAVGLRVILKSGLYVCQEYWEVYDIIQSYVSPESVSRILVVGSPGIGKSTFGIFLLLVLMTERKDVAYRPLKLTVVCYFTWNGEKYDISDKPVPDKTYHGLFDGKETTEMFDGGRFRHAYLFASPRKDNYNDFDKEICIKVVMNPWTKEECQHFADKLGLEDVEWFHKYNLVGGKPRYLFPSQPRKYSLETLTSIVDGQIPGTCDELKPLVAALKMGTFKDEMRHLPFLFLRNSSTPETFLLVYASNHVESIISTRYEISRAQAIELLLNTSDPSLQGWRGRELEKFLLVDLVTKRFIMKPLESLEQRETGKSIVYRRTALRRNAADPSGFGPLDATTECIQAASQIKNELRMWIPTGKNFPAIDGVLVIPGSKLVIYAQATVSTAHPIIHQHLKNTYDTLTEVAEFQTYEHILLFIVPPDIYDNFKSQPYRNTDKKTDRTQDIDINITQYVGMIDKPPSQMSAPADEEKSGRQSDIEEKMSGRDDVTQLE